ncbi:translesion error-prone DNA polymerase V subunit UmuC [Citrobacter enshiensis]|uniref:translesion error-prone DNA polymerase V subunit UmuC n=1 Tax=Citrobacter enshiensis TaxID=2971264 RepID=UPI0023E8F620|nr:translesion error-prone DNA polymerase V subunit UmuC [Citrobacter enshiensis]WET39022.1 translesion error-prone DNA polymerase V subunit UmuC [Citrobacter enshiensis]
MFALVDVNSFYASCETVFRPDLEGKPVVVVSNNDGCIISRSAQAKALGVKMGAPYFKVKDELRRQHVTVFSSNYALYADLSHRVMLTLAEMAPSVEVYSIDEAFIDLSGVGRGYSLEAFGRQIRQQIRKNTGLTVGVGIAQTKTLAKVANFAAKTWQKTGGVVDLSDTLRQRNLLERVPVEEVWGIGRRTSKKLNAMGITSALQLADSPLWVMRKHFSVVTERTVRELRGESCLAFDEFAPTKQQIICSRSFGHRITHYDEMHQAICTYAERAAEKLRAERQYCCTISVFMRTSPHVANAVFYAPQASGQLTIPSNDTRDIIRVACSALDRIWKDGFRYMKAGVMLSDFFSQGIAQLNLFDENAPRPNSEKLMAVLDHLNSKKGGGTLYFAGQGVQQQWQMKREMLSPRYTTRFSDLPVVK